MVIERMKFKARNLEVSRPRLKPSLFELLAEQQLSIHRAKLAAYREDQRLERQVGSSGRGQRTVEHWRGETLPMGIRYESAAADFWADVAARARLAMAAPTDSPPARRSGP